MWIEIENTVRPPTCLSKSAAGIDIEHWLLQQLKCYMQRLPEKQRNENWRGSLKYECTTQTEQRHEFCVLSKVLDLPRNSPAISRWASFLSRRCQLSQILWLFCDMDICRLGTKLRTLNSISLRREPDFNIAAVQRWKGNEDMRNSWMGKGHLAQQVCPPIKFITTHLPVLSIYPPALSAFINMSGYLCC